ncbi:MAG: thiamine pyrophosphate-dependent dehydrogenase E1 component subunit alpha [Nitrospinae bacterium]|nr:thiamine pyrophosphate-dependent dehydrogenase E1 component subunit alpha [Nitrospinota bacterium]
MKTKKWATDIYYRLVKIRSVEEAIAENYKQQEMRCPVHLSIGQEAVAVGVCAALNDDDIIFSTHRCHSHYLAKQGNLNRMIAELYGKRTGCAAGLGGSMHLVDESVGMMGSSAIVGGSIPLGVGAALSFKLSGPSNQVAVPFFGDGATEEGVFHESLSFAALHKLSVIFIAENNFVATASPLTARRPMDNISQQGEAFGIPGYRINGNNVVEVYEAAKESVKRARDGNGPSLIEARTYRLMSHVGPNEDKSSGSRTEQEWDHWRKQCPIKNFEAYCDDQQLLTSKERNEITQGIQDEVDKAFEFAKTSESAEWI